MSLLMNLGLIVAGFALLVWSADRFVAGSAAIARAFDVPTIIIGLTLVAIGSSAPELFVSATASLKNSPGIAVGNALGSNITNVGLVIGICALVRPLAVGSSTLRREFPWLIVVTALAIILMYDLYLSFTDGLILLFCFVLTIVGLVYLAKHLKGGDKIAEEIDAELPPPMPLKPAIFWTIVGLVVLPLSANILVQGASAIATSMGISDLVIGLTIVAIGTSLPELAASLAGVLKGEDDLAVGNVLGSNIFNLLGVLAFPGLLRPTALESDMLTRDLPVMATLTILFFVFAFRLKGQGIINRWEGSLLLATFLGYTSWLVYTNI
jgi:cation:H+ antiporter